MLSPPTYVKKITFELRHPVHTDQRLVRTLVVSTTIHVPEGYGSLPTDEDFGFVSFDYRDPNDLGKIKDLIVQEVIRSKIDGLSPHAVSDVIRTTKECSFQILTTASDRFASKWHQRFGVKLTMPSRETESLWFGGRTEPIHAFTASEWTGIGDPEFYEKCVYVSKIVAAGKAQEVMARWQEMGLSVQPIKTDVQEVCYGVQTFQLVSEMQRDYLHGGCNAFASYHPLELSL